MSAQGAPHWRIRRRIIHLTLIFCALLIVWCVWTNTGSRTEETAVLSAFALAGAVIGSYIFGAVWEDTKINASTVGDPTAQPRGLY